MKYYAILNAAPLEGEIEITYGQFSSAAPITVSLHTVKGCDEPIIDHIDMVFHAVGRLSESHNKLSYKLHEVTKNGGKNDKV